MLIARGTVVQVAILAFSLVSCNTAVLGTFESPGNQVSSPQKPLPAKFIETSDSSGTGVRSPIELGMAFHSSNSVFSESAFTSGVAVSVNRSWRPTMVGTTYITNKGDLPLLLPMGTTTDSLADRYIEIGFDSKTLDYLNNLQFDDRTLCALNSAIGQSEYEKYLTSPVVDPSLVAEISAATPSNPSEKYGDRYVRSIAKGFCTFFLIHLRVQENATYEFQTVKEAFYRLQGVGFGYVASENYPQDKIDADWAILKSDGNQLQTYSYSDLLIDGISSVKTTNAFFSYYQELQRASVAGTLSSKCNVAKVIATEYNY